MGLRLEVGHAQGVTGKYKSGIKEGVMTANQRRKARKREMMAQRGTAPARLGDGAPGFGEGAGGRANSLGGTPGWTPTTPYTHYTGTPGGYFGGSVTAGTPGYYGSAMGSPGGANPSTLSRRGSEVQ